MVPRNNFEKEIAVCKIYKQLLFRTSKIVGYVLNSKKKIF